LHTFGSEGGPRCVEHVLSSIESRHQSESEHDRDDNDSDRENDQPLSGWTAVPLRAAHDFLHVWERAGDLLSAAPRR
jgi:hypothetical protein